MKKVWIGAALVALLAGGVAWLYSGADERIERAERGNQHAEILRLERAERGEPPYKCSRTCAATGVAARNWHCELNPECSYTCELRETDNSRVHTNRLREGFLSSSCTSKDYSFSRSLVLQKMVNLWNFYVGDLVKGQS